MSKLLSILSLSIFFTLSTVSVDANANHCSGGHKEIKDTKDTSTEDSKEANSTKNMQRLLASAFLKWQMKHAKIH